MHFTLFESVLSVRLLTLGITIRSIIETVIKIEGTKIFSSAMASIKLIQIMVVPGAGHVQFKTIQSFSNILF